MDIQGYILETWKLCMSDDKPVLAVFDKDGLYYPILSKAEEAGIFVVDTTKNLLSARLNASSIWYKKLAENRSARMIIYRQSSLPASDREWREREPYAGFMQSAAIFPFGPNHEYRNLCAQFMPTKKSELQKLFNAGTTSFDMINALLDGQSYPALKALTGGESVMEITQNMLAVEQCTDMNWLAEWRSFTAAQFPGSDANGSTLKEIQSKLWSFLLFSEFSLDLPGKMPSDLASVPHANEDLKTKIFNICDQIRANHNMRDAYVVAARRIAEQLHLADHFANAKHLGERVTFNFENKVEYTRFIEHIKNNELDEASTMLAKNIKDVWCQEDEQVNAFWKLATHVLELCKCIHNGGVNPDGSLKELIDWYAESGSKADHAFRKFHSEKQNSDTPMEDELAILLNQRYREFTERVVKVYQSKANEIKSLTSIANEVCPQEVYPALQNNKRVAVVFMDAFRYEMGVAFTQSMQRTYADRITCSPHISIFPPVTRFGMANHLDHITLQVIDGKLEPTINGIKVITVSDRLEYLRQRTGVEVQDMGFDDCKASLVSPNTRLLVIRSTTIDSVGENNGLSALTAMDSKVKRLVRVVKECRDADFDQIFIVADHGFMLQPKFLNGDLIDKPVGSDICLTETRCIVGSLNETPDTLSFTPDELGIDANFMKIAFAKNFTLFKRGEVYFHEGLSLQENIVPIIAIKLKEEKQRQSFGVKMEYKKGTTNTVRTYVPVIDFNIHFSEFFADDVNFRLTVTDSNNHIIGEPAVSSFYDDLTEIVTVPNGTTQFRQKIVINDDYEGSDIVITALDVETNATLCILPLKFESITW